MATLPVKQRELVVNGIEPKAMVILDYGATRPMISTSMAKRMGLSEGDMTATASFVNAAGSLMRGQRLTRAKIKLTFAEMTR